MTLHRLAGTLTLAFLLLPAAVWASGESPRAFVESGINEVLEVVQTSGLDPQARRAKLSDLIASRFDFEAMGRSILARNWKKATPEQQARFLDLLRLLLENTYIATIENYGGETFKYGKEKLSGKKAQVPVSIMLKTGVEAPLLFKLRTKSGDWGVYDVVIEGVSLVSTYRGSFGSIVARDGMDGLLEQLQIKTAPKKMESS